MLTIRHTAELVQSGTTYTQNVTATSAVLATRSQLFAYGRVLLASVVGTGVFGKHFFLTKLATVAGIASFIRHIGQTLLGLCGAIAVIGKSSVILNGLVAATATFQKQINKLLIAR